MATLYVTEYAFLPNQNGEPGQLCMVPAIAEQTVSLSGSSAASAAFNAATRFVRLSTDSICSFTFATSPTATTSMGRMPANTVEYFAVIPGSALKVAAITNT